MEESLTSILKSNLSLLGYNVVHIFIVLTIILSVMIRSNAKN